MQLDVLSGRLAVARLPAAAPVPDWTAPDAPLLAIIRTPDELTIVCAEDRVPPDVTSERGWRALVVEGPLDLSLTGILASLAAPLAEAVVPIFALSTFDTDYVLVRDADLEPAITALTEAGHDVSWAGA